MLMSLLFSVPSPRRLVTDLIQVSRLPFQRTSENSCFPDLFLPFPPHVPSVLLPFLSSSVVAHHTFSPPHATPHSGLPILSPSCYFPILYLSVCFFYQRICDIPFLNFLVLSFASSYFFSLCPSKN